MRGFMGGAAFGGVLVLSTLFCVPAQIVQKAGADGFSYQEAQIWENDRARVVEAARRAIAGACKSETEERLVQLHREATQAQARLESKMGDAGCDAAFRWLRTDHAMKFGAGKAIADELKKRGYRFDADGENWVKQEAERK